MLGVFLVALLGFGAVQLWPAASPVAEAEPVFAEDGIAIRGYDPVAYFTADKPVAGSSAHAFEWNGVTWHFANAEHRERFAAKPEMYAPAYGGYCAWAVAEKGELWSIDPHAWHIVDGTLYLNYSDAIQQRWEQDIPGFIKKGDERWAQIIVDS
ncbi:YHS domain protein [Halomonas sp. SH5A2]|nr:YHS domain protein [Halomonas sp. SH5A2]